MSGLPPQAQAAFGHLLGGLPDNSDLAPSIVFTVAFVLLLPVVIWRLSVRASRNWTLIRPLVYIVVRIVTWIIRAIQATGSESEGLFIAEQVLLSAGSILLVEPLVALTTQLLEACIPNTGAASFDRRGRPQRSDEVGLVGRVLRLAMLACLVITIYSSSNTSSALTDPGTANTLQTLRKVVAALIIAAVGISALALFYFSAQNDIPVGPHAYLVAIALLLLCSAGIRLANALGAAAVQEKAAFYVGIVTAEYIATVLFLAVNLNTFIPKAAPVADTRNDYPMDARGQQPQLQYAAPQQPYSQQQSYQPPRQPYPAAQQYPKQGSNGSSV